MIIDEQGKVFGKASIVDIGIAFVILLTIAVLFVRVVNPVNIFGQSKNVNCEYTVTIKNIRMESVEAIKKSIGKSMYDSQKIKLGVAKEILEVAPSNGYVYKTDGSVVKAPYPERFDIKVRIAGDAIKSKGGVLIGGRKEILNGSRITMSSPEITVETLVTDIITK